MRGRSTVATSGSLLAGEPNRLPAHRVTLAQRVALPVVGHQDPAQVRVAREADAHHVPRLSLVPVGGRPDRDDALDRLAVVEPDLDAHTRSAVAQREQVVVEREPLRFRAWNSPVSLRGDGRAERRRRVQVTAAIGPVVAGDSALAPVEVVGRCQVREEVEALDVAEMEARLLDPRGIDDERRLAVLLLALDEARDSLEGHDATPRIS